MSQNLLPAVLMYEEYQFEGISLLLPGHTVYYPYDSRISCHYITIIHKSQFYYKTAFINISSLENNSLILVQHRRKGAGLAAQISSP